MYGASSFEISPIFLMSFLWKDGRNQSIPWQSCRVEIGTGFFNNDRFVGFSEHHAGYSNQGLINTNSNKPSNILRTKTILALFD